MPSSKILQSGMRGSWLRWGGNDSLDVETSWKDGCEPVEHTMCGFAGCNDAQIGNAAEVEFNVATAQHAMCTSDTPRDGGANVQRLKRSKENVSRELFSVHLERQSMHFQRILKASGFSMFGGRCP